MATSCGHKDDALTQSTPADIQNYQSVLHSAIFYPGDAINYTQANGTITESYWLAAYGEAGETGPLTTAGDFYNYFVLGILPASYDPENPKWWPDYDGPTDDSGNTNVTTVPSPEERLCASGSPGNVSWCLQSRGAYPNDPDYVQTDLARLGGGVVSAYILDDQTAVLSIPSFLQQGNDTLNFFRVIDDLLADAEAKNIKRLVIDLQQNYGGLSLLAVSIFKRFFYDQEPWTGNRIRATDMANVLGQSYSSWWDGLETSEEGALDVNYQYFASSEWVVGNRINPATGTNYTSWDEYKGPVLDLGDKFTNLQLYNLSDQVFDAAGFQGW